MASFIIEGGYPLSGEITPQGAKNEALQVICATLLTSEEVTIHNIPDIRDVNNLIQLLSDIGVRVKRKEERGNREALATERDARKRKEEGEYLFVPSRRPESRLPRERRVCAEVRRTQRQRIDDWSAVVQDG